MREDLQFLEQVDAYLNGSLSGGEKLAFENQLENNAELNDIYNTQKDLIQAAKRKALLAEIQAIGANAGGTSWIAANAKWILSLIIIGVAATSAYYLIPNNSKSLSDAQMHLPLGDSATGITNSHEYNTVAMTEKKAHPQHTKRIEPVEQEYGTQAYINSMSFFPNFRQYNSFQSQLEEIGTEEETDNTEQVEGQDQKGFVNNKIYNRPASFPNGNLAMKNFIKETLQYPQDASSQLVEANVQVDFIVDENGKLSEISAKCFNLSESEGALTKPYNSFKMFFSKKLAKAFENEALRIVRLMPTWEYATNNRGLPITSYQTLYFDFNYPNPTIVYQLQDSEYKAEKGKGWKYQ